MDATLYAVPMARPLVWSAKYRFSAISPVGIDVAETVVCLFVCRYNVTDVQTTYRTIRVHYTAQRSACVASRCKNLKV